MGTAETNNALFVGSIEKGMRVLQAFNCGEQYLSLNDMVSITGMNKSAVQRFSYTWESLGYLKKEAKTRRYSLTPKSMDIVYSYLRSNPLVEIATPKMVDFKNTTGLTINLSVIDGTDTIYVLRIPSHKQAFQATLTGRRVPAFCSSGARAMMSLMPEEEVDKILDKSDLKKITPYTIIDQDSIREEILKAGRQGYALNKEECLLGEIVISAPVINSRGEPIAAVHIPAPINEWPEERIVQELASSVIAVARSIQCP